MKILILNLLLAYLIGDFILQTAKSSERKSTQSLHGKDLYIHAGVIFLLSWLSSWNLSFWWAALLLATLHLIIDALKVFVNNKIDKRNEVFWICQIIINRTIWLQSKVIPRLILGKLSKMK